MRVLFLADSGPDVGGGHVMRCLTLANVLQASGAVCGFLATPEAAKVLEAFADQRVERLPAETGDLPALTQRAEAVAADWGARAIVVDHYGLIARHEARLAASGRKVIALEDAPGRQHVCDLLVDAAPDRAPDAYRALTPADALTMTGPSCALVRPEFAAVRTRALARRGMDAPAQRVLVSLGLTDFRGITGRVLNQLRPLLGAMQADVVVGAAAPSLVWLKRLEAEDPRIRIHVETREMARLMSEADLAIGAGGSSTWERACLGLPAIDLILADNQRDVAVSLDRVGATIAVEAQGAGFAQRMTATFVQLSGDSALRASLSLASAELCDGLGAQRVAEAIMTLIG